MADLIRQHFTIEIDHRDLQFLHSMNNSNAHLTQWAMALYQFSFTIRYRLGKMGTFLPSPGKRRSTRTTFQDPQGISKGGGGGRSVGKKSGQPTNCRSHSLSRGTRLLTTCKINMHMHACRHVPAIATTNQNLL